MALTDAELSILITDDSEIARLNKVYLNREGPTNVISFSMREGKFSDITPHLLGDVVISADTAAREGKNSGMGFRKRLTELLVHGILHLAGYDHETPDADSEGMERKFREIIKLLERS